MADISLRGIGKAYGPVTVIQKIDLEIASGEFLVLVGPSGCGKSTLLRMIAGLEEITSGSLSIGGRVVNALPPAERNIAMVFQDYALYPHMTVAENMGFGLKMRDEKPEAIARAVDAAAETLKIQSLLQRKPAALSGGQRQRVAMGRAIVRAPEAFLFDEPLSNLDAALRIEMRLEIARLHRRMQATTVYVTHDQVEAMTLADRIVVLNAGHIEQVGAPLDLYRRPASLFVARFIGSPTMNVLNAPLRRDGGAIAVELPGRTLPTALPAAGLNGLDQASIGIRPEDMSLCAEAEAWFSGQIAIVERLGGQSFGYLDLGGERMMTVELPRDCALQPGDAVCIGGNADRLHLFAADGARLG